MSNEIDRIAEIIPTPETIRARLAEAVVTADLLRRQLRLSERAERMRNEERRLSAAHAG